MKDHQELLKLQAYLDGELPSRQKQEVNNWLAADPEAAALLTELRTTRQALVGFEGEIKLPESREFYWSKIQRVIQSQEASVPNPAPTMPLWLTRVRRLLVPAAGLALLAIIGILATQSSSIGSASVETAFSDSGALTYHDSTSGTTLVWLSYPAENELLLDEGEGTH